MAYQVIKQALVWTKQETQLSYEIENRIIAGYLGNTVKLTQLGRGILLRINKIINLVQNILFIRYVKLYV
jgi:hypothetical protein